MYAVNVADLSDRRLEFPASIMIAPVVPNRQIVDTAPKTIDGAALVLECDDDRALAIVAVLRMKCPRLRAYRQGARGKWAAFP